jgi:hypothetical protein
LALVACRSIAEALKETTMVGGVRQLVLLLPVLFSDVGCSYAFVHGPPATQPTFDNQRMVEKSAPDCTSSNAAPILDTVIAVPVLGLGVLAIVAGAGETCGSGCYGPNSGEAIAIGAALTGLGVLALSSAITGYGRTADCRRAQESFPIGSQPGHRYLLDVPAIAQARAAGGS